MKVLIVEDDFTSRVILQSVLSGYGTCHVAVNGKEAINAFCMARESGQPYDLVCMDIRMPEMDGQAALRAIRAFEESKRLAPASRAKIIMTTALDNTDDVMAAVDGSCDAYLLKPIDVRRLLSHLQSFHLA